MRTINKTKEQLLLELRTKEFMKKFNLFKKMVDNDDFPDYNGKRVKIILDTYLKDGVSNKLNPEFYEWLGENGEKVFTARLCDNVDLKNTYELEGVENWLFNVNSLEEYKE